MKEAADRAVEALSRLRQLPEFAGGVETPIGRVSRADIKEMEYRIELIGRAMERNGAPAEELQVPRDE